MKHLNFDLEGRLIESESKEIVNAKPLSVPPALIGVDTRGLNNSNSFDKDYLRRLDQTVSREEERKMLPIEANAYVPSWSKAAGREEGYVWVAIQFYKTE